MKDQLTIQIPFDLARYAVWQRTLVKVYETNAVIKALDTWLVLKAESRSSLIQSWNQQKKHLCSICKIGETVLRYRLKLLRDMQLVKFDEHNIWICSWDELALKFEIDVKNRFTIQYQTNDKKRVQDWLLATEIKDNQNRQAYKIFQKLGKNPLYRQAVISEMLKAGADRFLLKDSSYFLSWLKVLYYNDFVKESEIHKLLIEVRPDTNRGVKGIANAWKCKKPHTVSYWKKVLQTSGIIDISRLQIESQDRVRNESCRVLWLQKSKQTLLCLCDAITVLMPWTICKDFTYNTNSSMENLSAC